MGLKQDQNQTHFTPKSDKSGGEGARRGAGNLAQFQTGNGALQL